MTRILITGAGGSPSTNFIRSLRQSLEKFFIIGVDCNKYYLQRAETQMRFLVPEADDPLYIPVLKDIIRQTQPELIYSQPDPEIFKISQARAHLGTKTFLPAHRTIAICQDKLASYHVWQKAGLSVPATMLIKTKNDLKKAFRKLGEPLWLRSIVSHGGGKGSFFTDNLEVAGAWITHCKGWGSFSASQCLSRDTVTWLSIWHKSKLVVAQSRKRLYWELGSRAPSGVTGITGTGVTISDPEVDAIAQRAILAIDKSPHGIFAVDMTYDKARIPNPTEINIGRFFTTHLFFTKAGLNLPYIFVKLALGRKPPHIKKKINPLPDGLAWIRGMDFLPLLTSLDKIHPYEAELKERKSRVGHGA